MPAQHEVISICPVCSGDLEVTRLHCATCGTALEGRFSVSRFARLDRDQMAVLDSFLRSRGNLREMERDLGISYPTVRNRLEALLRALGMAAQTTASDEVGPTDAPPPTPRPDEDRQAILERLAAGEISPEAAAAAIRGTRRPA